MYLNLVFDPNEKKMHVIKNMNSIYKKHNLSRYYHLIHRNQCSSTGKTAIVFTNDTMQIAQRILSGDFASHNKDIF